MKVARKTMMMIAKSSPEGQDTATADGDTTDSDGDVIWDSSRPLPPLRMGGWC